jgi:arylsulfatase
VERPLPPSIVLIVVDTLRADRIGRPGAAGSLTPRIDQVGRRGVVFANASTPAPFTMPAIAALLTGSYADRTGIHSHSRRDSLDTETATLATVAKRAGYRTLAVITNPWLAREAAGFGRGFDRIATGRDAGPTFRMPAEHVTDMALQAVDRGEGPFLLWAHYMDAHMPYRPPAEYCAAVGAPPDGSSITRDFGRRATDRQALHFGEAVDLSQVEATRGLYDAAVRYVDDEVGRLLAGLDERGTLENAIVVVTADHGEALGDHGLFFAHDFNVYEELLRVPLIIVAPRIAHRRSDEPVSLIDVLPTLCHLASLECPNGLDGISLLPPDQRSGPERPLFAASAPSRARYGRSPWTPLGGLAGRLRAVRIGSRKLIRTPLPGGASRWELYDLAADPAESENLYGREPHERLAEALAAWEEEMHRSAPAATAASSRIGRRTREELRGLGYLD